jgi:hypothetical protein
LEHRVFLHYFIKKESANVPKYIFKHMIKELRESQNSNRCWIPYGRLISEILHQEGILKVLKELKIFTDDQLGTETCKVINGQTLRKMKLIGKGAFKKLSTDLKESDVVSALMNGFPPICKHDPIEVQIDYIMDHFQETGKTIRLCDVPETMYGGALPVAKSRKTKRKALTKEEYLDDAPEKPKKKRAKKEKASIKVNEVGPDVPNIQQEVQDLDTDTVLNKRTRSGKAAATSQSAPDQPSIPKKKRKTALRKLKESSYVEEDQIAAATDLVTREVKKKKIEDAAALEKIRELAKGIEVPVSSIAKEDGGTFAQQVVQPTEEVQELVTSEALSPSSSTKLHKKPTDNTHHVPRNSNINERIIGLS